MSSLWPGAGNAVVRRRDRDLRRRYGVGLGEYERLERAQGGRCAICGEMPPGGERLAVDHDHGTGVRRGLLCGNCNKGLGHFKDDVGRLERAIVYLGLMANRAQTIP